MTQLKVSPHSIESEQYVLAGIFINPKLIKNLKVSVNDFYREPHALIYKTMVEMDVDGVVIEPSTLAGELDKRGILEKIGGREFLISLLDHNSTSVAVPYHEGIIRELSLKRSILKFSYEIGNMITNGTDVNDIVGYVKDFINNIRLFDTGGSPLTQAVREFVDTSQGVFMSSDVVICCQVSSRKDKQNISKILSRLCENTIIERTGIRNGQFRRIENDFKIKDLSKVVKTKLDIRFPLGMEKFVAVKPGNIIMYAGTKGSGKSSLLLDCARLNMRRNNVWFFSFEADEEEILERIETYPTLSVSDWKVNWVDDPPNYVDIIQPNDVNIIDYVEARGQQEAYHVPQTIREIHDRLKKGICILAVQRNKDKKFGVGGEGLLAKPRVVCNVTALDKYKSLLSIESCKIRSDYAKKMKIHPEHWGIKFTPITDSIIEPEGDWRELD